MAYQHVTGVSPDGFEFLVYKVGDEEVEALEFEPDFWKATKVTGSLSKIITVNSFI